MKKPEHALRREVAGVSRVLWARGYVANHDGNVSARVTDGRIVTTLTSVSKRLAEEATLIVIDERARVVRGVGKPPGEVGLHLAVYAARPDVGAVVHAHPPYATARAVLGRALPAFLAEAVVSVGAEVPVVPFAMPGEPTAKALLPYLGQHDVVLLGGHGVLAWGDDPEQAYLRLELAEHLAKIAHVVEGSGGRAELPRDAIGPLVERHRALFPRARG